MRFSLSVASVFLLLQFYFDEIKSSSQGRFVEVEGNEEYDGLWRKSLNNCWIQNISACNRAMTISHGGDWDIEYPYDSFPAFQRAWSTGADTVKGDFRVSLDNIGMVSNNPYIIKMS